MIRDSGDRESGFERPEFGIRATKARDSGDQGSGLERLGLGIRATKGRD